MRPGLPSLWHCSPLRLTGQQQPCNLCPALIKALAGNQVQRGVPGHCKGDMHYSHTAVSLAERVACAKLELLHARRAGGGTTRGAPGWPWLWLEGQASARQMEREVGDGGYVPDWQRKSGS